MAVVPPLHASKVAMANSFEATVVTRTDAVPT